MMNHDRSFWLFLKGSAVCPSEQTHLIGKDSIAFNLNLEYDAFVARSRATWATFECRSGGTP